MTGRTVLLSLAIIGSATAAFAQAPDTGIDVDPQSYEGVWYEIARTPAPFQQNCEGGVTAYYEIADDETLRVVNRCDLAGGEVETVEGTAVVLNERFNAFDVEFPQSPPEQGANYLIEAVGPLEDGRYSWAAVRSPDGPAWILAREPELDHAARQAAESALADAGVDLAQLEGTTQPPQNYDPAQP